MLPKNHTSMGFMGRVCNQQYCEDKKGIFWSRLPRGQQSEGSGMKDNLIVRLLAIPQNLLLLLLLSVTCPVMYSCNSIPEEKSCRKAVSLRFHFTFPSLSGRLLTWHLGFQVLVLALISLCQNNTHFLCLMWKIVTTIMLAKTHILRWLPWSELHLCLYWSEEEATRVRCWEEGLPVAAAGYSGHLYALCHIVSFNATIYF